MESHYEILGDEKLRQLIDVFVERVIHDVMIGFFFRGVDIPRLKQREYEFARGHLGGPTEYTGRPLQIAHARHPILGGQFNRRIRILEQVLQEFQVPDEIRLAWLAHNESLRSLITHDPTHECNTERAAEQALAARQRTERALATARKKGIS